MIDYSRHAGFLPCKHSFQSLSCEFFGRKAYLPSDEFPANLFREAVERSVDGSGGSNSDADAVLPHFMPDALRKAQKVIFRGFIHLEAGEGHPCAYRGHVEDISISSPAHVSSEETA